MMPEIPWLLVGMLLGGAGVWLAFHLRLGAAERRAVARTTAIVKLGHDLRGAITPAMLQAERLELHEDPQVQKAAVAIVNALDRAASLAKSASTLARSDTN
jgi:signal transduction histidine kinase